MRSLRSKDRLFTLTVAALVSSLGHARPAKAQGPEVEIVQTAGACPQAAAIAGGLGEAQTLDLNGLVARADATEARTRVFCSIRLRVNVEQGYAAIVGAPQIKGKNEHDPAGSADLSVRWFVTGQSGDQWFRKIVQADSGGDFAETPAAWGPRTFGCGEVPELNLLVDATARFRGDGAPVDPTRFEALAVQQIVLPPVLYKRCDGAHP
jgi:hypothetical protein